MDVSHFLVYGQLLWTAYLLDVNFEYPTFIGAGIGYDSQKMHSQIPYYFYQKWNHFLGSDGR